MIRVYSSYGPLGASTRVRLRDWMQYVGLTAEYHSYLGLAANSASSLAKHPMRLVQAQWRLARDARWDAPGVVIVGREAGPLGNGAIEAGLLRRAQHGVFDFDDAIYLRSSGLRGRLFDQQLKFARAAGAADVVIAGNAVLAEQAARYAHDVRVIPSCVDPGKYQAKRDWTVGTRPRLVWVGSASTEAYLMDVLRAIEPVVVRTNAVLTVVSAPQVRPDGVDRFPWVRRVPWSFPSMIEEMVQADIALAPLRDDPFARGKCAYKLLQYASAALPMIGTPVGANKAALQRFDGLSCTSVDDWAEALEAAIDEPQTRRRERGEAATRAVREHYSFHRWERDWRSAAGLDAVRR